MPDGAIPYRNVSDTPAREQQESPVAVTQSPKISPELSRIIDDDARIAMFLASLMHLAQELRDEHRLPTAREQRAFEEGYGYLSTGCRQPTAWRPLGTSGFRPIQTWLSLADPGPGHLDVTVISNKLLHGTVVHLEQINRDREADKEKVEPYRLPAPQYAAWVRLHVGTQSPVTAFVGRPVFENRAPNPSNLTAPIDSATFTTDLLKTVHLHASACSCMFSNGIADCKIAIEHMSSSQAITFMKTLANKVLRDGKHQYLSAAFNINTPLYIDHDGHQRLLTERKAIARAGIEITRLGGFNKIAWDGASNNVPSEPITTQLNFADLVDLVHAAHERGLETYISAGMKAEDMRDATNAGIGGVGIGTGMHYSDTKQTGRLNHRLILQALRIRDEASRECLGQSARLLARLDILAAKNFLTHDEDELRLQLYESVRNKDTKEAECLKKKLTRVCALPDKPIDCRARSSSPRIHK